MSNSKISLDKLLFDEFGFRINFKKRVEHGPNKRLVIRKKFLSKEELDLLKKEWDAWGNSLKQKKVKKKT